MKYPAILLSFFCVCDFPFLNANCARCDEIRAYNLSHPENNYTYYDDYLKVQKAKENPPLAPEEKNSEEKALEGAK